MRYLNEQEIKIVSAGLCWHSGPESSYILTDIIQMAEMGGIVGVLFCFFYPRDAETAISLGLIIGAGLAIAEQIALYLDEGIIYTYAKITSYS